MVQIPFLPEEGQLLGTGPAQEEGCVFSSPGVRSADGPRLQLLRLATPSPAGPGPRRGTGDTRLSTQGEGTGVTAQTPGVPLSGQGLKLDSSNARRPWAPTVPPEKQQRQPPALRASGHGLTHSFLLQKCAECQAATGWDPGCGQQNDRAPKMSTSSSLKPEDRGPHTAEGPSQVCSVRDLDVGAVLGSWGPKSWPRSSWEGGGRGQGVGAGAAEGEEE